MIIPTTGRIVGVDWGVRRIGLAITDETQLLASPLDVLTRRTGRRFPMREFLAIVTREAPAGLVVGLPLDDDGMEGESALAARAMGESIAARTALPTEFIDESFSTAHAIIRRRESGARTHQPIDSDAAAELLQQWLDTRRRDA